LVTSEPGCLLPLHGCMFLFGLEMKNPWLICWVCFRSQPGGEEIVPVPVPFMFQFQSHSYHFVLVIQFYGKHLAQIFENADNSALCCRPPHLNTQ
jgi:hypothetical protein